MSAGIRVGALGRTPRLLTNVNKHGLGVKADVLFNYVASKANVADLPSRWALGEMQDILRSFSPSFSISVDVVDLNTPECLQSIPEMWDVIQARLQAPDRHQSRASRPRASHKKRSRPSSPPHQNGVTLLALRGSRAGSAASPLP